MSKFTVGVLAAGFAVLCTSSWAMADAVEELQKLFPDETKAPPRSVKASAEYAAKLLKAAKSVRAQKGLRALLCEKAYEFGMKGSAGYEAAAEAMKLLIEVDPDNKAAALEKLLKVTERRRGRTTSEKEQLRDELVDVLVACGDERVEAKQPDEAKKLYQRALRLQPDRTQQAMIMRKIKELDRKRDQDKKIAALRDALTRDEKNTAVREQLILAYVAEQDDPNEAAKLVTGDVNEGLRTYVPLATKKVEALAEAACLDLAEWYLAIAENEKAVSKRGKSVLLGKAQACYERYLELHPAEDAERFNRKKLLEKVNKAMDQLMGAEAKEITLTLARGVTMKLVRIPAGSFVMGGKDKHPMRKVRISRPFYMGITEVTKAQYGVVMGRNPDKNPDHPMGNISWFSAVAFCKKLSEKAGRTVRLPTEAEWEYAGRAGTTTTWSFGDDADKTGDYAWFPGNAEDKAHPVGKKRQNPWGLYDMHGNVKEWCSDWFADSYLPAGQAGAKAKPVDPRGPNSGEQRVERGGAYSDDAQGCRSASRHAGFPGSGYANVGFRVVAEVAGVD